jgi:hypothetical protein
MDVQKYLIFSVVFIAVFTMLQLVSGLFLTLLYTPKISWEKAATLPSHVELVGPNPLFSMAVSLISCGIAAWCTKWLVARMGRMKK